MKIFNQIVASALIGILIFSTIGVTIHEHYCQNELVIATVGIQSDSPCACDMPMQDNCCKDVATFYSLSNLFNFSRNHIQIQPTVKVVAIEKYVIYNENFQSVQINNIKNTNYVFTKPKVYLKVQSFLL